MPSGHLREAKLTTMDNRDHKFAGSEFGCPADTSAKRRSRPGMIVINPPPADRVRIGSQMDCATGYD